MSDFSPEQQLVIAAMRSQGYSRQDAEHIVEQDRVYAALLGAHLRPVVERAIALVEAL